MQEDDERRRITITFTGVKKRYMMLGHAELEWMLRLYSNELCVGRKVRFMEWADQVKLLPPLHEGCQQQLELFLHPVGVEVQPQSEEELRAATCCVLKALEELHARGWVHLDVRWPNVVRLAAPGEWCLVDCEFARPLRSALPSVKLVDAEAKEADVAADLFLVGCMLVRSEGVAGLLTEESRALGNWLLDPDHRLERTAARALNFPFFGATAAATSAASMSSGGGDVAL
jgi:hypothetical protein